jgi:glycine betaine/choline ABC-type transport system substrate-binding protein
LEELSGKISDATMRRLNYEVDGKHRRAAEVARDFLRGLR